MSDTPEIKQEEPKSGGIDLSSIAGKLGQLKVIIPIIAAIASTAFGFGYKVQSEVHRVDIARYEAKLITQQAESTAKLEELRRTVSNQDTFKKQFIFMMYYLDYILAKNDYVQHGGDDSLFKLKNTQNVFADYIKQYKSFMTQNAQNNLEFYMTMSSTSISIGGKEWPIPRDVLMIMEGGNK